MVILRVSNNKVKLSILEARHKLILSCRYFVTRAILLYKNKSIEIKVVKRGFGLQFSVINVNTWDTFFRFCFTCFRLNNPLRKGMPLFLAVEYIARNLGRERSAIFISPRYLCAIEIRELWHV